MRVALGKSLHQCGGGVLDLETSCGGALLLELSGIFREKINHELAGAALHCLNKIIKKGILVLVAETFSVVRHLIKH